MSEEPSNHLSVIKSEGGSISDIDSDVLSFVSKFTCSVKVMQIYRGLAWKGYKRNDIIASLQRHEKTGKIIHYENSNSWRALPTCQK